MKNQILIIGCVIGLVFLFAFVYESKYVNNETVVFLTEGELDQLPDYINDFQKPVFIRSEYGLSNKLIEIELGNPFYGKLESNESIESHIVGYLFLDDKGDEVVAWKVTYSTLNDYENDIIEYVRKIEDQKKKGH